MTVKTLTRILFIAGSSFMLISNIIHLNPTGVVASLCFLAGNWIVFVYAK
jgi:hypothetical protein